MRTPKRSSAATTISTIESESTSRSPMNPFSGWTVLAGMPAISSTIVARSVWMSVLVAMAELLRVGEGVLGGCVALGPPRLSGALHHLGCVSQAGAEGDEQSHVPALGLAVLAHAVEREGDRG